MMNKIDKMTGILSKWTDNNMIHIINRDAFISFAALLILCSTVITLHAAETVNVLQEVTHVSLPGNRQQLALKMSESPTLPRTFTIDNPARIALDFSGTKLGLAEKLIPIGSGLIRSVTAVEAGGRTRVVVNLASMASYRTQISGNDVLVTIDSGTTSANTASTSNDSASLEQMAKGTKVYESDRSINSINFRRGPNGEGRVLFELSKPGIPMDIKDESGRIVISFAGTRVNNNLLKRLDVMDFGTPVHFIDTRSTNDGTRVVIQPAESGSFEQLAYQSDSLFTLELKPMLEEEMEALRKKKFGYTGERLSLNFQDIEIRSVLQLLADFTDLNIVVSDNVEGKLTLRLKNVPWDQALDIILKSKNLGKREAGNIIMVAPAEEIAARERIELEAQQQKIELAPLHSEFIQINYAAADEFAELLKPESGGILSERGNVAVDERTNTLLISDTADKLDHVRALIAKLDIPIRQVLIESRIVVATDDFNKELGFRMGVNRNTTGDNGEGFVVSGNHSGVEHLIDNEPLIGDERFNVNLPSANVAGSIGIALAKLPIGSLLELELSAMQAEGKGEVISSPRIITANQHEAFIEQGVEIPYLEASSSGATSVSFRKAVLGLKATPHITPDDRIIMDLTVNKDTVGEIFGQGDFQIPSIDTREVSTQVLVDNGETVVLGGIYEQEIIDHTNKIPFFGDLPFIGRLFQHTVKDDNKSELLIFVTPKIVRENNKLSY